jgi:hypothetical protein
MTTAPIPAQPSTFVPASVYRATATASRLNWAKLEENRLAYAFSILLFQTAILAPLGLWTMNLTNGGDWQMAALLGSCFLVLIPILAALSLKTIVRLFSLSLVVCLGVVAVNLFQLLH